MYFNGRKDIVEADDFDSLHELELVNEDGHQYIRAVFHLNPNVKQFEGEEKPSVLHLTDGVSHRFLRAEPKPAPPAPPTLENILYGKHVDGGASYALDLDGKLNLLSVNRADNPEPIHAVAPEAPEATPDEPESPAEPFVEAEGAQTPAEPSEATAEAPSAPQEEKAKPAAADEGGAA